eukprot:203281-Prymnesium_polylepis.1
MDMDMDMDMDMGHMDMDMGHMDMDMGRMVHMGHMGHMGHMDAGMRRGEWLGSYSWAGVCSCGPTGWPLGVGWEAWRAGGLAHAR